MITIKPGFELDFYTHYGPNDCLVIRKTEPIKEGDNSLFIVAKEFAEGLHGQIVPHPKGQQPENEIYIRVSSREYNNALLFGGDDIDFEQTNDEALRALLTASISLNF